MVPGPENGPQRPKTAKKRNRQTKKNNKIILLRAIPTRALFVEGARRDVVTPMFVEGEGAGYSGTLGDHRDNLGSGGRGMQGHVLVFVEGEGAGHPGIIGDHRGSSGQLGVWQPRYAGWGWPGGLFLKSNNPNLSGGE